VREIEIAGCDKKIFVHETIQSVIESYFKAPVSEIATMGGFNQDGKEYEYPIGEVIANIEEVGCWGFVSAKEDIHLWFRQDVEMRELVRFFAHEKGHTLRPFHRDPMAEELKAGRYEDAAIFGFELASQLLKRNR
jgi:uncharacterized protein YjaZ